MGVAGKVGSYLRAEREGCFAVECFWGALGLGRPDLVSDVWVVVSSGAIQAAPCRIGMY